MREERAGPKDRRCRRSVGQERYRHLYHVTSDGRVPLAVESFLFAGQKRPPSSAANGDPALAHHIIGSVARFVRIAGCVSSARKQRPCSSDVCFRVFGICERMARMGALRTPARRSGTKPHKTHYVLGSVRRLLADPRLLRGGISVRAGRLSCNFPASGGRKNREQVRRFMRSNFTYLGDRPP
jgi:hypothetical protein